MVNKYGMNEGHLNNDNNNDNYNDDYDASGYPDYPHNNNNYIPNNFFYQVCDKCATPINNLDLF